MHPRRDARLARIVLVRGRQPVDVAHTDDALDPSVRGQLLAHLVLLVRRQHVQVQLVAKDTAKGHTACDVVCGPGSWERCSVSSD